ncbi:MAG TPA: hypothetical protein VKT78_16315 [Fimbriimonadaceae bacterium]|nr:hypothetical protein [Fimbriimonadaceae bacterium]
MKVARGSLGAIAILASLAAGCKPHPKGFVGVWAIDVSGIQSGNATQQAQVQVLGESTAEFKPDGSFDSNIMGVSVQGKYTVQGNVADVKLIGTPIEVHHKWEMSADGNTLKHIGGLADAGLDYIRR